MKLHRIGIVALAWTLPFGIVSAGSMVHKNKPAPATIAVAVATLATPDGGIQPQAIVDRKGQTHVIYFKGNPAGGDLYYVRFTSERGSHTSPLRVNSEANSAGAIGTVRAAQIAIGQDDRVHIVWNGLGPKNATGYPTAYQAYTRLNDAGTAFEPQRNLTTWAKGLDGGGSITADRIGNVYVTWHALADAKNEAGRAVFITHSSDNGKTFSREKQANPEATGACACCGMKVLVDHKGLVYVLYRAAGDGINRDTVLLISSDKGATFQAHRLDHWKINVCPMSTYALAENAGQVWAAWETEGRIFYGSIDPTFGAIADPQAVAGEKQKHPFLASGIDGQTLLAWTEGTGWQQGGALAWTVLHNSKPVDETSTWKLVKTIPVWGLPTAYPTANGFIILH